MTAPAPRPTGGLAVLHEKRTHGGRTDPENFRAHPVEHAHTATIEPIPSREQPGAAQCRRSAARQRGSGAQGGASPVAIKRAITAAGKVAIAASPSAKLPYSHAQDARVAQRPRVLRAPTSRLCRVRSPTQRCGGVVSIKGTHSYEERR